VIFDGANARTLAFARIWIFGLAAVSRLFFPTWEICYITDYTAVGVMKLLGAQFWAPLITPAVAYGIEAVTIGLLLAAAAGIRPYRLVSGLAVIAFTVSEGLMRGEGVMPHLHMGLLWVTYVLVWFPAADALVLFGRRRRPVTNPVLYQAALVTASLVFAFTYTFAAARRLSNGGLGIYLDNTILASTAMRYSELGEPGGLGIWACESPLLASVLLLGFPLVTLFELLSPLWVFSGRFRWAWIAFMVPFHFGTGFLMVIWFTYNLALIPLLVAGFVPSSFRGGSGKEGSAHESVSKVGQLETETSDRDRPQSAS
jgi:hypothetical protein